MKPSLLLLFNHRLTPSQKEDARLSLGVEAIVEPPPGISRLWVEVPTEVDDIGLHLTPVVAWLKNTARPGDFVLVQGEFGATLLLVNEARRLGLIPVYSTTMREALEEHTNYGQVHLRHTFRHVRYRRY